MMKVGLFSYTDDLFNNSVRDDYAYRWGVLRKTFTKNNIDIESINKISSISSYDIIIELDIKNTLHKNCYLLVVESPLIRPENFDLELHQNFKKIFTWNDDMVDNQKYFKINYAFDIPKTIPKKFTGKKLCCTIAGNKYAKHPDELYTKRVEFIRWFEKYHPDDFDLYGTQWNQYRFGHSVIGRVLNRVKFLRKKDLFPSYKGMVESKFETMQNYKFAICYENIKDQNGYITEKIFDCFFAGCIPIYWGAKNVTEHIPKECFIDKRDFDSFEDLYDYMVNMQEREYMKYLDNIENFLNSSKADPFRAETFANTIVNEILKDIND